MKLIAGLGNPGKEYAKTRHNSGWIAIDRLAETLNVSISTEKWNALVTKTTVHGEQVILMKPLTYMNESGIAVQQAVHFYHIDPKDILILHDDMDLPVDTVRIREKGSSGGQKGMQSIIDALSTNAIPRVRIGVGHSKAGEHDLVPNWVLSGVPKELQSEYDAAIADAAKAAELWVYEPLDKVMNQCNRKPKQEK